jgi:hypothetical protein
MANIWHGADPTAAVDANDYELGQVIVALEDVELNGIRVWSPANAVSRASRKGHVWSMTGALLGTIDMTEALTSGWTTHLLASPLSLSAGDHVVISYETSGNYGATSAALSGSAHVSTDQAMAFPASQAVLVAGSSTTGNGRFSNTPGSAPDQSVNHAFYGVDADYSVTGAGTAPTLSSLTLTTDGLDVTATLTASDPDGLVGATYAVNWGDGNTSSGAGTSFQHTYAQGGLKAILASVTDSTGLVGYRAGAVDLVDLADKLDVDGILAEIVSHAQRIGHLAQVNQHEPKSAPEGVLTGAVWAQELRPLPSSSGLNATTVLVAFNVRIYKNMLSLPQDAIDPEVLAATDALMAAYSGDFTLGGLVRNVDLLGEHGEGLFARAGYVPQDGRLYRILDISVPCVINDLWVQSP